MLACDFLTVDAAFLKRYYVLVFIELQSRRVHLGGITASPTGAWVTQQARNVTMSLADGGRHFRFLVHDRDAKFTASFNSVFAAEGAKIVLTPPRAPQANAVCERWIGSARRECLDRMLTLSRPHLERTMKVYIDHHNHHRPHRSLGMRPPVSRRLTVDGAPSASAFGRCRERLGGVINEYYAAAA